MPFNNLIIKSYKYISVYIWMFYEHLNRTSFYWHFFKSILSMEKDSVLWIYD